MLKCRSSTVKAEVDHDRLLSEADVANELDISRHINFYRIFVNKQGFTF